MITHKHYRHETLGKLCTLKNGTAFTPSDWSKTGVPIIRIQNLNNRNKPYNFWSGPLTGLVTVKPGDILFAWSGTPESSFGAHLWQGERGVLNQHIFKIEPRRDDLLPEWLTLAINAQIQDLIYGAHGGVGLRHVTKKQVEALEILLPTLAEQRNTVTRMARARAEIDLAYSAIRESLQAARELISTYLREIFSSDPLSIGPKDLNPPRGWRWRRLTEIARLESGHTPSRKHPEWWGGDTPWIALPDIRNLDGKIAYNTIEYINEAGIINSSARLLPQGTVVLSRTASVGFTTVMGRPMATSQDFANWVCSTEILPGFLMLIFQRSKNVIRAAASGATHKTVYMPTIREFYVCIPSRDQQESLVAAFEMRLSTITRLQSTIAQQLSAVDSLYRSFLRQAFNLEH